MGSLSKHAAILALPLAGFLLTACQAVTVQQAQSLVAIDVPMGDETKPVAFKKIVVKVPRNKSIGKIQMGIFCMPFADFTTRGGRYQIDSEAFNDLFREELGRYNYTVVGNPDDLFGDEDLDKAEYFVAGLITNLEANACFPLAGLGDYDYGKASVYMDVNWQLYSTLDRKVVFRTDSNGSFSNESAIDNGVDIAFEEAFALATQNLLANREFYNLVSGNKKDEDISFKNSIKLVGAKYQKSKKFDTVQIRPSVVTIRSANGHGSGFIVSSDGYVLTNAHVVGSANTVRVILHSGRGIPGEVIRRNSRRDVALIKLGEGGLDVSSVSFAEPEVGTEIFVYGTPLAESLDGSLTKGIVSAYRNEKSGKLIQSDVTIQPGSSGGPMLDNKGNVVAVAVAGMTQGGVSSGQNFFIPLKDALKSLNVRIQ